MYDQNFEFLMFDDAVEMSIQQALDKVELKTNIEACLFYLMLESNPFFNLEKIHRKEAQCDYDRLTPEIQRIIDAFYRVFNNKN